MDFSHWIESNIKILDIKMIKSMRRKLEEMNERGLLKSTISGSACLTASFETMNDEIIRITSDFGKLKLIRKNQIDVARKKIMEFIINKAEYISSFILSNTGMAIGKTVMDTKIEEAINILTIYTEIIEQERKSRVLKFWWDTLKIVVSAIVGGLLSIYLKDLFGKS